MFGRSLHWLDEADEADELDELDELHLLGGLKWAFGNRLSSFMNEHISAFKEAAEFCRHDPQAFENDLRLYHATVPSIRSIA